ncbi:MAG: TraR/DksA family transcriptional regulator [Nitrospiraceae bacterium]
MLKQARRNEPVSKQSRPDELFSRNLDKYGNLWRGLQQQRAALMTEANELLRHRPEPETLADPADQASVDRDRQVRERIQERIASRLRQIERALSHMTQRGYGLCVDCGQEIPLGRLKVQPDTLLCLSCKVRQEAIDNHIGK